MRRLTVQAVRATYMSLDPQRREHNFELLGMDFMIDEQMRPWLIEINTNPCLEMSCPLLARLIPTIIEQTFRYMYCYLGSALIHCFHRRNSGRASKRYTLLRTCLKTTNLSWFSMSLWRATALSRMAARLFYWRMVWARSRRTFSSSTTRGSKIGKINDFALVESFFSIWSDQNDVFNPKMSKGLDRRMRYMLKVWFSDIYIVSRWLLSSKICCRSITSNCSNSTTGSKLQRSKT